MNLERKDIDRSDQTKGKKKEGIREDITLKYRRKEVLV